MPNFEWVTKIHRSVYRKTGGRLGARLGGMDMVLLTTTGRKSGEPRSIPLACFREGDALVVVASNNGQDHHPAWWLNLEQNPEAQAQLGPDSWPVRVQPAEGAERDRLWAWLKECNPAYRRYEKKTPREIPVVVLKRIS